MLIKLSDDSLVDESGKLIYCSMDRFIRDIVNGGCCFICGVSPEHAEFNDEHVLPDWMLARFGLYQQAITLPNNAKLKYRGYKTPCCKSCNILMGRTFEGPIRQLLDLDSEAFSRHIRENGPWQLFVWLALIFLKTHLKDQDLYFNIDRRQGTEKIGDSHYWPDLHYIHCIARSFYTGVEIEPEALGSFFVLPAKSAPYFPNFDYADLQFGKTIPLRLGEIALVAVFNDSCAALNYMRNIIKRITGPLSPLQLREFLAHCAYINIQLKKRPNLTSVFDANPKIMKIKAELPDTFELEKHDPELFGNFLHYLTSEGLHDLGISDVETVSAQIKAGKYQFLFDHQGIFQKRSMEPIEVSKEELD